ncbi:hypothetical protein IMZ11_28715 [Microtetraspora sp. AC03309]|uniref:DUF6461 domain-containing protein n=1 Tax=Microtetraspora sp. AC03309 TaxID=2779376 RepID=UPI001E347813|nr:DUF6461 domain-containing protein [Microtetraspora sp. AC03309]MCC5579619.1 hypothetical protein [Microtetraspora sp. AC03309]
MSINRHDGAADGFVHSVDDEVVLRFTPLARRGRKGADPERWKAVMKQVGLGRHMSDPPIACAFALAEKITGVALSEDVLGMRFLVARTVADEH